VPPAKHSLRVPPKVNGAIAEHAEGGGNSQWLCVSSEPFRALHVLDSDRSNRNTIALRTSLLPDASVSVTHHPHARHHVLNRKWQTSPSCITYDLPSLRILPASRIAFSLPNFSMSGTV
jgi:hypothetical protein